MKHVLLATLAIPSLLLAQSAQPIPIRRVPVQNEMPADALADNYELTLTMADKDSEPTELSVVVSSTRFTAQLGDPTVSFSGTLTPFESGVTVSYTLAWETAISAGPNTQFKSSSIQGSVRLKLGEEIPIIHANKRTVRLKIKKLGEDKAP